MIPTTLILCLLAVLLMPFAIASALCFAAALGFVPFFVRRGPALASEVSPLKPVHPDGSV